MDQELVPQDFDANIAHITDKNGHVFQIVNADGSDWAEDATAAAYEAVHDGAKYDKAEAIARVVVPEIIEDSSNA